MRVSMYPGNCWNSMASMLLFVPPGKFCTNRILFGAASVGATVVTCAPHTQQPCSKDLPHQGGAYMHRHCIADIPLAECIPYSSFGGMENEVWMTPCTVLTAAPMSLHVDIFSKV